MGRSEWKHKKKKKYWKTAVPICIALLLAAAGLGAWRLGWIGKEENWETMAEAASEEMGDGLGVLSDGRMQEENSGEAQELEAEGTSEEDGQDNSPEDNSSEDNSPAEEETAQRVGRERKTGNVKVKGIYVTGPVAGSGMFQDLLTLADDTELNSMVIDVKNDEGKITWKMDLESASAIGACTPYIPDMEKLMGDIKEHQIYTIARIVCFKDPYLAEGRPELALKKEDGTAVMDANGMAWVNPYKEEVWEYLVNVAEEAAEAGFDEIQFDYVRFPIGSDADAADYGADMDVNTKRQVIGGFLNYAVSRLHEKNIIVTADVFGTIIRSEIDAERVGQDYAALGECVDVLSPMVYPSHYENYVFGLEVPDAKPYETVLAALEGSVKELSGISEENRAIVRPWLQAFTATWVKGHISYEGEQIRQQIQAVYDAGYDEWILWNAVNRYSGDGLMGEDD